MKEKNKEDQEIKGLFRAGAFLLAFFTTLAGFILLLIKPLTGTILWFIGFAWMAYLLFTNIKDKQKSGFKTANIAIKIILMLFMLLFFTLILFTK